MRPVGFVADVGEDMSRCKQCLFCPKSQNPDNVFILGARWIDGDVLGGGIGIALSYRPIPIYLHKLKFGYIAGIGIGLSYVGIWETCSCLGDLKPPAISKECHASQIIIIIIIIIILKRQLLLFHLPLLRPHPVQPI